MRFRGPPALKGGVPSLPHGVTRRTVSAHLSHGLQQALLVVIHEAGLGILNHFR